MTANPSTEDMARALINVNRIKIIGLLAQGPVSRTRIASELGLKSRQVYHHLEFLKYVRLVVGDGDHIELDAKMMERVSHSQLISREKPVISSYTEDHNRNKELSRWLNPDGTIRHIPNSRSRANQFRNLLEYIVDSFVPGASYTEQQVNNIISRLHPDFSGLRRDLVDAGLLNRERDGSRYWCQEKD